MNKILVQYGMDVERWKVGEDKVVSIKIDQFDRNWVIVSFEDKTDIYINANFIIQWS